MKLHNPKLVGALLDGELKGLQRLLMQRHVNRCAVCAAEHRHQRHVRAMLTANPPGIPPMSDSPDFFWSKIKREIQVQGDKSLEVPVPRLGFLDWLDRRRYGLTGVAVCLVAAGAVVWLTRAYRPAPPTVAAPRRVMTLLPVTVVHVSTLIPNSVATPVETKDDDDTVIWVSGLPWTPDMSEMKTLYANLDT
jgi:hypothetical protein